MLLVLYCVMMKQNTNLREMRKQWFHDMEQNLQEMHTKEDDSLFYYHSSEDRIGCRIICSGQ